MAKNAPEWRPESFLGYFDEAATRLGYDNLPLAWGIAGTNWKSRQDLTNFLNSLVNETEAD